MKNSRINRIFSAQAGPRIAHSIDQVWSVCDADYSVTYGWNRSPEFLICCSVSKRFCLLWKAFHHLNKIRYILWVEALLETCDATNSGCHLDRYLGYLRDGPLEKLWGGEGNFRAAGIFFRYQIPCMNFF